MNISTRNWARPFLYGITLVLGLAMAFDQLSTKGERNFIIVVLSVSIILLIEIYTSWLFYKLHHPQIKIVIITKYDQFTHWAHHILLPFIAFYASAFFIYYNRSDSIRVILYLVDLFIFMILFYNIRSYFEHDSLREKMSHYVYDILKLYIFFIVNNAVINLAESNSELFLIPITNLILTAVFLALGISRKRQFDRVPRPIILIISTGVMIGSIITVLLPNFNPLELAFANLVIFYFANAILHHLADHTLKLAVIIEYLAVLLLIVSIFINF